MPCLAWEGNLHRMPMQALPAGLAPKRVPRQAYLQARCFWPNRALRRALEPRREECRAYHVGGSTPNCALYLAASSGCALTQSLSFCVGVGFAPADPATLPPPMALRRLSSASMASTRSLSTGRPETGPLSCSAFSRRSSLVDRLWSSAASRFAFSDRPATVAPSLWVPPPRSAADVFWPWASTTTIFPLFVIPRAPIGGFDSSGRPSSPFG